jgi:hypothetical protein
MKFNGIHLLLIFTLSTGFLEAQTHQLIISEIFADPTPSRGLPEKEFIEIKNNTLNELQLKGFKFLYGSSSAVFSENIIAPGERVIVCRKGNESELLRFGRVITLSNFSLSNDGNLLVINSPENNFVTSVNYSSSWYSVGKEDGFSLEMIDESQPCKGKENWTSSISPLGATPGAVNSVSKIVVDNELPFVISQNISENILNVYFNENVNTEGFQIQNFEVISGEYVLKNIEFDRYSPDNVLVVLDKPLAEGDVLEIRIKEIEDCVANQNADLIVSFTNVPLPQKGDILISEILFNPVYGGEDFIEIKNVSNKSLNLKNWKFAKGGKDGVATNVSPISDKDFIIKPFDYLAFTKNKDFLINQYPLSAVSSNIFELSVFPGLNNDENLVLLLDEKDITADSVKYNEKMHNNQLANPSGVSLERGNFVTNAPALNLWQSASTDVGYATPGRKNSQEENDIQTTDFYVDKIIFNPYNEGQNKICKLNYQLPVSSTSCNISILDRNGNLRKKFVNNGILGSSGQFEWDGTDDHGSLLPVGYYVFKIEVFSPNFQKIYLVKTVLAANN